MHTYNDNPYRGSPVVEAFRETGKIAFIDIDGTLTFADDDFSGPLAVQHLRELLKDAGIPLVFSSARTPELMMSRERHIASIKSGFKRMPALRGPRTETGLRTYTPLENLEEFKPFLDPDGGILGFGTGVFPCNGTGYTQDSSHAAQTHIAWRYTVLQALRDLPYADLLDFPEAFYFDILQYLSPIEDELAYGQARVDVEPLAYRIQFDFESKEDSPTAWKFTKSRFVLTKLIVQKQLLRCGLLPIQLVDESKPDEGRYTFYLMPGGFSKPELVSHFMTRLCEESGRSIEESSIFIAGDSLTDLPCCDAAPGARGVFVLAGKSRLGRFFRPRCNDYFADQDLTWLRKRLKQAGTAGTYKLLPVPGSPTPIRDFIVSDIANPGMRAPQSVANELTNWIHQPIN
jgi:hypothetical protein